MSSSIKRAIGYAMPWHRFEELTMLDCEAHLTRQTLEEVFDALTDQDLTVDMETYDHLFYKSEEPSIGEIRLLSKTYTNGGRKPAVIGCARDLYVIAQTDEQEDCHIIFFPNLNYRSSWYRSMDTLDWSFERWREGTDRYASPAPDTFYKYVDFGHERWSYSLMNKEGMPEPWRHFLDLRDEKHIVPAPPSEIRWYLTKHRILDNAGVNQLRPIVAQWWR